MESNNRKIDRRSNRTRRQLKEALLSLILEKGYDAVTIEDITQRADLGRTTFYLHYKDKEDLLLSSVNEMVDDFIAQVSPQPVEAWRGDAGLEGITSGISAPMQLVFEHAEQNADLYRVVLQGTGRMPATSQVKNVINGAVKTFLLQNRKEIFESGKAPVPLDIFVNYFTGALLGLLTWWLENDTQYSAQEMAEFFRKLFFQGTTEIFR